MSPVPVRDIPGYISSGNKLSFKSDHQPEHTAVNTAIDFGAELQHSGSKTPPIVSSGWSSKKEFYRDYLKKKYANQKSLAHPKQITVEHVEPVDPKTLLSYDRRFLPVIYSNLKQKLLVENDETAVESSVAEPESVRSLTTDSHSGNHADGSVRAHVVSSEPVFPVSIGPIRQPVSHGPELHRYEIRAQVGSRLPSLMRNTETTSENALGIRVEFPDRESSVPSSG